MTATTTAAGHAWNALVAGDCWPVEALDFVMEADGCEREKALAKLHEAAADWLGERWKPNYMFDDGVESWKESQRCSARSIQAIHAGDCDKAESLMNFASRNRHETRRMAWLTLFVHLLDAAIARLRELAAIPGGES